LGDSTVNREKIIFTNGCFDVIHAGHLKLLEFCASLGTVIVGINSDASIRKIKGDLRPINNEFDRQYILSGFRFVDKVIIFDEDKPYQLIQQIKPDIIVKGGDSLKSEVIGNDLAEVRIFPLVSGLSTSKILSKITTISLNKQKD
jgi:D-beta-D-heptose 7-phosphate kinase/D-beta-D-heptose 1-phosphate adenosyltransferase